MRDRELDGEAEGKVRRSRQEAEHGTEAVGAATLDRGRAGQAARAEESLLRLQRQYGNRYVQRVVALSRKAEGETEVAPGVEEAIERARGGGQALDNEIGAQMETAFGTDFSGVRVHTDAQADRLNQALNARAFTTGQDIFFRQGAYNPGSPSGQELLAHELTHVLQQDGSDVQPKLTIGQPDDKYEQEANESAQAIVQQGLQTKLSSAPWQHVNSSSRQIRRLVGEVIAGGATALGVAADIKTLFSGKIEHDDAKWLSLQQIGEPTGDRSDDITFVEVANRERSVFSNLKILYRIDYLFQDGVLNAHARLAEGMEKSDYDEGSIKVIDEVVLLTKKDNEGRRFPRIQFKLRVKMDPLWEDMWAEEFRVEIEPGKKIQVFSTFGKVEYIKEESPLVEFGRPVETPESSRKERQSRELPEYKSRK